MISVNIYKVVLQSPYRAFLHCFVTDLLPIILIVVALTCWCIFGPPDSPPTSAEAGLIQFGLSQPTFFGMM